MAPLIPEHALVSLLRQCFLVPSCKTSRIQRQSLSNISRRALHSSHLRSHYRRPHINPQPGCRSSRSISIHHSAAEYAGPSASFQSSEIQEYGSSTLRAEGNGRGQPNKPQQIAVLGGGITGLSAAHYLSRELPNAQITIYEGGKRLGGWLNSEQIDVGNGYITVEQGPRTLRAGTPASLATLEIIHQLGLQDELLITDKSSAAALNRFIYYPDRLVRMPGPNQDFFDMAWRILTEPVFKGMLGAFYEPWRPSRPNNTEDESVASFLTRRMGSPDIANNIVSAVFHGVYAGDVHQLSAKSLMPSLRILEVMSGSIGKAQFNAMMERKSLVRVKDLKLRSDIAPKIAPLLDALRNASVYSFKTGIGALTGSLSDSLKAKSNVTFKLSDKISSLTYDGENDGVKVKSSSSEAGVTYDKVVSTISGRLLSTLTPNKLPSLAKIHAVTVMVVNLFFTDPNLLTERGFGYLIPRSIPFEQNPECALGVVFDSDAVVGQDTATGTKVTVMIGGHWWDGMDAYPDEEEGRRMALAVLGRHLGIHAEPAYVKVGLQRECIPQYTVGHEDRMAAAHKELMAEYKGKLLVAGNSYEGVGLNDCVRSARDVVMGIKYGKIASGLEDVGRDDYSWVNMVTKSS